MSPSKSTPALPLFSFLYFVILLPFLQLGTGYYSSIAALGSVLVFIRFHRWLLLNRNGLLRIAAAALMLLSYVLSPLEESQALLRICREVVFFYLITGLIRDSVAVRPFQSYSVLLLAMVFTAILTLFIMSQAGVIPVGRLSFPNEWYYLDDRALPTDLSFLYAEVVRPNGFYTEPSYAALVLFSVVLFVQPTFKLFFVSKITLVMAVISIILTQSASGIIFVALLIAYDINRSRMLSPVDQLIFLVAVVLGLFVLSKLNINVLHRVASIDDESGENSGFTRLVAPLSAIWAVISISPFGLPVDYLVNSAIPNGSGEIWEEVLHNGFFNFFIEFGLTGIAIAACFLSACRDVRMGLFVVAILMQNGGPLSIDKFVLFVMTAALYNSQIVARNAIVRSTASSRSQARNVGPA